MSLQDCVIETRLCCRDSNGMWQSLGVYSNVALDARDIFACVITLVARCVSVLQALRVHD